MADYLVKYDETHALISNHLLGAAAGLQLFHRIGKDDRCEKRAAFYIDKVLARQSPEGWYEEYGGADPGYQTLALYYLANYFNETGSERVFNSLVRGVDFISYFVHPDGSFGGEYGSRNTEIFYPGGLSLLQNEITEAASLLDFMIDSIQQGRTVNLNSIDTGNLAPLMNNYLELMRHRPEGDNRETGKVIPFVGRPFVKEFKEAGIVIYNGEETYAVIGISKGGVIKEFDKKRGTIVRDDCGYIGSLKGGEKVSTQNLCIPRYSLSESRLIIEADFFTLKLPALDSYSFLLLRLFNLSLGRIRVTRERIKRALVKKLIVNQKKSSFKLTRTLFLASPLEVKDRIEPENTEDTFVYLEHGLKFSTIHMASARYWYYK
jgi:hypothetical protein